MAKPKSQKREEFRIETKGRKSQQAREMARPTGVEPVTSASGDQTDETGQFGVNRSKLVLLGRSITY